MEEKIRAYISNVEKALSLISGVELDSKSRELVELARAYMDDAKYYIDKGDYFTSLACIAYAEGLLDALKRIGKIDFEWEPLSKLISRPKVFVAGSFEILHPGHLHILEEAWKMGRVYVVVSRDASIRRFKGRDPIVPEEQRLKVIEALKYVYRAILGDEKDFLKPVEELKPDIILLGPDQWISPDELKKQLEARGIRGVSIVKLNERIGNELYSTTGIVRRACSIVKNNV
ncbi:DUF357 domain-containing protein [Thermogladius sp. 4427co]|uniref:DUF357 domain-containing protein n=1 Tax=Thermogladius sp. 4427co TaxID=3450718 RepID=UPI003F78ECB5